MTSTGRYVNAVTDAHVARLHTLLSTPGVVTRAVRKLGDADRTFSMLDIALRRGGPVPACWAVSAQVTGDVQELEHADELHDAMSETLRTTGNASVCLTALREAVRAWRALDSHLVDGGVLPSPWSRQAFPRVPRVSSALPVARCTTQGLVGGTDGVSQ